MNTVTEELSPQYTHHNGRFAQCHNLVSYLGLFIPAIKAQEAAGVFLLKTKMQTERPTNKQQLQRPDRALKRRKTQHVVMSMRSRLQAVGASKRFSTKCLNEHFIFTYLMCPVSFEPLK